MLNLVVRKETARLEKVNARKLTIELTWIQNLLRLQHLLIAFLLYVTVGVLLNACKQMLTIRVWLLTVQE